MQSTGREVAWQRRADGAAISAGNGRTFSIGANASTLFDSVQASNIRIGIDRNDDVNDVTWRDLEPEAVVTFSEGRETGGFGLNVLQDGTAIGTVFVAVALLPLPPNVALFEAPMIHLASLRRTGPTHRSVWA